MPIFRQKRSDPGVESSETRYREPTSVTDGIESAGSFEVEIRARTFDQLSIELSGRLDLKSAESLREKLFGIAEEEPLKNLVVDLGRVEYFDSSAGAVLMDLRETCDARRNAMRIVNVPKRFEDLLCRADPGCLGGPGILERREEPGLIEQVGDGTLRFLQTIGDFLVFVGASVLAVWQDILRPGRAKWDDLGKLVERTASDAVPIVTALAFLSGATLAFQAAIQLRKFGANLFVADLVSVSMCLEMGPLITALIVAGRSGAGFAAHIGTMQVNEEIDALRIMGIDPVRYLVTPRILAVALALPCLTLIADAMGILGGCLVASLSLDLTPTTYMNQVTKVLEVSDVMKGLTKSLAYGIEIALIGCLRGFQVRGGAESVGAATTSSVVTSIFVIVLTDAVFAVLFHYIRWL